LVFHLKRFKNDPYNPYINQTKDKIRTKVIFPITNLDMTDFVIKNESPNDFLYKDKFFLGKVDQKEKILYDLVGVSNHYGSMALGHYTSFCKNNRNNQ
jgi:ubiquitin C-terminal hydrolase